MRKSLNANSSRYVPKPVSGNAQAFLQIRPRDSGLGDTEVRLTCARVGSLWLVTVRVEVLTHLDD